MHFLRFLVGGGGSSAKEIQAQERGSDASPALSQKNPPVCINSGDDPEDPADGAATDCHPSSEGLEETSPAEGENLDLQSEEDTEQGTGPQDGAQEEGVEEVTGDGLGARAPGETPEEVSSAATGPAASSKVLLPEMPAGGDGSEDCWDRSSGLRAFLADALWDESSVDFGGEESSVQGNALGEDDTVASLASSQHSSDLWKWLQEDLSSDLRKEEEERLAMQKTEVMPLESAPVEGAPARTEAPVARAPALASWSGAREDQRSADQRHVERLLESVETLLWGEGTLQDLNGLLRATHAVTGLSWKKINRACRSLGLGLVSHVFHRYDLRRELLWNQELRVPMAYLRTPELREVRRAFCVKLL